MFEYQDDPEIKKWTNRTIKLFTNFNQKVEEIQNSFFFSFMCSTKTNISPLKFNFTPIQKKANQSIITDDNFIIFLDKPPKKVNSITLENLQAIAPTMRIFCREEENFSFYKLHNHYDENRMEDYESEDLLRQNWQKLQELFSLKSLIKGYKIYDIFEGFIYGNVIHMSNRNRTNWIRWLNHDEIFPIVLNTLYILFSLIIQHALIISIRNNVILFSFKCPCFKEYTIEESICRVIKKLIITKKDYESIVCKSQ